MYYSRSVVFVMKFTKADVAKAERENKHAQADTNKFQSPINIDSKVAKQNKCSSRCNVKFLDKDALEDVTYSIDDMGRILMIPPTGKRDSASLTYQGRTYTCRSIVMSVPSCHTTNRGERYPGEIYAVYQSQTSQQTVVVSTWMDTSSKESHAKEACSVLARRIPNAMSKPKQIDLSPESVYRTFFSHSSNYYMYTGSMPNSDHSGQNVTWVLLDKPCTVSGSDMKVIRQAYKKALAKGFKTSSSALQTTRDIQPIQDRRVMYVQKGTSSSATQNVTSDIAVLEQKVQLIAQKLDDDANDKSSEVIWEGLSKLTGFGIYVGTIYLAWKYAKPLAGYGSL